MVESTNWPLNVVSLSSPFLVVVEKYLLVLRLSEIPPSVALLTTHTAGCVTPVSRRPNN